MEENKHGKRKEGSLPYNAEAEASIDNIQLSTTDDAHILNPEYEIVNPTNKTLTKKIMDMFTFA